MMKIISVMIKPPLAVAFIYLAIVQLQIAIVWVMSSRIPFEKSLCLGILGGIAIGFLVKPGLSFIFIHEITHWIAALCRGVKPKSFYVEKGRGFIQLRKITAVYSACSLFFKSALFRLISGV